VLKPPPPDANWARRLIHQGWELAKFYGRGVKLVWHHRSIVAQIKARARKGGAPITRAEHRFIQTFHQDVKKLVPFIIIALLLEEIIPLIALYVPSMLPSTCILPSQRERIHQTKLAKATVYTDEFRSALQRMSAKPANFMAHRDDALVMCGVLRLPTWGPNLLKKRRISKHLAGIVQDDVRLLGENRGMDLKDGELTEALEERGLCVYSFFCLSHSTH
jgi:LETM1 and EF-hand domain-containing protein 1